MEEDKKISVSEVIKVLESLDTFEVSICGGCECCGTWLESEKSEHGEWIRRSDVESLIELLKKQ